MNKKSKSWFRELFEDERHILSSKRILGAICIIIIWIIALSVVFIPDLLIPPEFVFTTLSTLSFGLLGLSTIDKFSLRKEASEQSNQEPIIYPPISNHSDVEMKVNNKNGLDL